MIDGETARNVYNVDNNKKKYYKMLHLLVVLKRIKKQDETIFWKVRKKCLLLYSSVIELAKPFEKK